MNRVRAEVLRDCRRRAADVPGLFTLTVPTGGGKTLASMAFALDHAVKHGLDRVIVVIPYTSIIEQSAAVYKKIFGNSNVVEHHSSFDPPEEPSRLWLAAENWNAPVIVTTSVQFFESLFANRTSAARKLHNIARSVVVLDEVQTFPTSLLAPIVDALGELALHYATTIVLATATQPALRKREAFPYGLDGVREIIAEPGRHFRLLERVRIEWPVDFNQAITFDELSRKILPHPTALVIVHLRNDARELAELLEDSLHLSALMCAQHRSEVLAVIRKRLVDAVPCRLVATQLVEAGVDVDFPVVFRALGGLDSIAQAAGRCNREGKLDRGLMQVFVAPSLPPMGVPRRALEVTKEILRAHGGRVDLNDPAIHDRYFQRLYASSSSDSKGIQAERRGLNYESVAAKFRMIEDGWQKAIVIPYDPKSRDTIDDVRRFGMSRRASRRLQRYSVNVSKNVASAMLASGIAEDVSGDEAVIALRESELDRYYSPRFGLDLRRSLQINPEDLIA
ncbi:MAG TPA: CRISPR-associated helicase Cas3' [Thermoanaerobaculia bacterium]|nr:CRISPR-associated helicase Cas3' [Thermoanaerobaculia bacterium]